MATNRGVIQLFWIISFTPLNCCAVSLVVQLALWASMFRMFWFSLSFLLQHIFLFKERKTSEQLSLSFYCFSFNRMLFFIFRLYATDSNISSLQMKSMVRIYVFSEIGTQNIARILPRESLKRNPFLDKLKTNRIN